MIGRRRFSRAGTQTISAALLMVAASGLFLSFVPGQAHAQVWIDVKTGQRVNSAPIVGGTADLQSQGRMVVAAPNIGDPARAFDPTTGRNFAFDKRKCQWIDVKTGQAISSAPIVGGSAALHTNGRMIGAGPLIGDSKRAFDPVSGRNFVFDSTQCAPSATPPLRPARADGPSGALPPQTPSIDLQKLGLDLRQQVPFVINFAGGPLPDAPPSKALNEVFQAMNKERTKVGSNPLIWHPILAQGAQQTANAIARPGAGLEHTPIEVRGAAGENIAGGPGRFSIPSMGQVWINEGQFFTPGIYPDVCDSDEECRHYSQVVDWKSILVGCGGVEGTISSLVCWFFPAGNVRGQPVLGTPPPFGQPPVIAASDPPVAGGPNVREPFAGVRATLLSENYVPYNYNAEIGFRFNHNEPDGPFSADTYKFEADWQPIRDIRFRGSYNRAVRAPNIVELFAPGGIVSGFGAGACPGPAAGGFDVNEAFAELRLPLLRDTPFFHRLELTGAARYSDYSTSGSTTTFSAGVNWQPIEDLLFRGSWAEGFRAPTIGELFGTPSRFDQGANPDPVNPYGDFVFTPRFLPRLSLEQSYFDIAVDRAIANIDAQVLLGGGSPPSCQGTE